MLLTRKVFFGDLASLFIHRFRGKDRFRLQLLFCGEFREATFAIAVLYSYHIEGKRFALDMGTQVADLTFHDLHYPCQDEICQVNQ